MRDCARTLVRYFLGSGLGPYLIRASAGSGAVQLAGMIASFGVGVLLARGLGVERYGYYGIAMAVIALIGIPGEFGVPQLVTREVAAASARQDLPRLFGVIRWANRMAILIALPAAGATALGAYLLLGPGSSPVAWAIMLGAPIIPLVALTKIRGSALQGLHQVVLGQVPFILLRPLLLAVLLLGLFALIPGAGAPEAMALNAVTAAAALLASHLWLRAQLPQPRPTLLVEAGRSWLGSSMPMALSNGMRLMRGQLAVLLMGLLVSAADVGLFRVAVSVAVMVAAPNTLLMTVTTPLMTRLYTEGATERLQKLATSSARAQFMGTLLLSLPLMVAPEPLLGVVFGRDFEAAAVALQILCAAWLCSSALGLAAILLNMTGHERRVTRAMAWTLGINAIALILLVPRWGDIGAASATALSMLASSLLNWRDARQILGIDTSVLSPRLLRNRTKDQRTGRSNP